jgi:hypothetical protein
MGSTWTVNNEHLTPHTVNFTYDFYMDSTHVTQKIISFMNMKTQQVLPVVLAISCQFQILLGMMQYFTVMQE